VATGELGEFSADSAMAHLVHQVSLGPRVPGTGAHRRCAEWIEARLRARGLAVERDPFMAQTPDGKVWPLVNLLGRAGPPGDGRILFVAHWDTRPWADQDPDPARRDTPIPGANDGASGVAVLLELARCLAGAPLPRGVDLLFADGEDLGRGGDLSGFCLGSRRFAAREAARYWRVVVVDMVGDRDLEIPMEPTSARRAPEVVDWVWTRAARLAPEVFTTRLGPTVYDDHVPFLDAGVPAVDLIDFDYPAWHTLKDDLDQVEARSLGIVGRLLLDLARNP
jgi:acetylornithine deacetylase/succinyl-diaminopimelate desuccinylase-like protein